MKKSAFGWLLVFALVGNAFAAIDTDPVQVQILAINDFHGNLEPPTGSGGKVNGIEAGGAEFLATHLRQLRMGHPHTITVSAGDLFGASPLLSALFRERPTVEAMNLMGLDLNAVGNHEFDKGWHELLDVLSGENDNALAQFGFLAANVVVNETGKTLFPPYAIREFGGAKIAFVGLVLETIDRVVVANAIKGLTFLDEADTVNALIPELHRKGIETIVVMIHEGGFPTGGYDDCPGISGPIVDIAERMGDEVGVILSGHTHQAYNCRIGNKLVTSAASNGRLVTNVNLMMDPVTNRMMSATANNVIVTRNVEKALEQTELIKHYKDMAAPIANRVVGQLTEDITKAENPAGESALGRMLADAQVEVSNTAEYGFAQIGFMNPGGIRTDLTYPSSKASEGDGNITFGEAFSVQPFGNNLIIMTLTGAQIIDLLEQQFAGCGFNQKRILQISRSLHYTYRDAAPPCEKIDRASVTINDEPLTLDARYRVVANNFLAEGGDGFSVFKLGVERMTGVTDMTALQNYLEDHSPVSPDMLPRITRRN